MGDVSIFDIEANGLNPDKIWVLSVYYQNKEGKWCKKSTTDYDEMRKYFLKPHTLVGHYIKMYDIPVVERILDIKIPKDSFVIDTCALSWALYPGRASHGLEDWGVEFGSLKKPIDDWDSLPIEEYIERCEGDIKINLFLWLKQFEYLDEIYDGDKTLIKKYINYLMHKMDCLHDQEVLKVKIDRKKIEENMNYFLPQKEEKVNALIKEMPKVPKISIRKKPKKFYTKDGELSKLAEKWLDLLEEAGLPQDYEGDVEVITGWEDANPSSPDQVKDWLFSLGWKPLVYKESTLKDGSISKTPQVRDENRELCVSVKNLIKTHPAVGILDGLTVINHRIGVLKSFLENADENDYVVAGASAFTNTLRLKHVKPIANLPKVTKKNNIRDGRWIREIMIAPEGYEFCGSDMSSLEDRSKQHYIYAYDPQYVHDMMTPDFDPHLDLAVAAGALTQEQADAHKKGEADYGAERHIYKTANYSAVYGVGAAKLAVTVDCTVAKAKAVLEAYWQRNWSVKQLAKDQFVKTVQGQMWQRNPMNGFYYSLRYDKDRFSTLNQGGATFIFDVWVYNMRKRGIIPIMQYHDEMLALVKKQDGERERVKNILKESVQLVNKQLSLLREMDVDVKFGANYADVH